jgi:hypothetical protein
MDVTLYSATAELRHLLDQIDPESGELPDELEQAREVVKKKAVNVAAYCIETSRQAEYLAQYAKEVNDKVKAAQKRVAWLRKYLMEHMSAAGITKVTDERGLFSAILERERDKYVDPFAPELIPHHYTRFIPATNQPDLALIKKAIQDGYEVPGAVLKARDRLTLKG